MPSARASRRGAFLNCRLAVKGIQNADCSSVWAVVSLGSARLFMRPAYSWRAVAALRKQTDGRGSWAEGITALTPISSGGVRHHLLLLLAQPLDGEAHDVARLEEHRRRLDAEADARRRARGDDVARQERHVVRDV